jgi:hypothetical protein
LPAKDEHLQKCSDNESLASNLAASTESAAINWRLVMLHYAALHYVEAYFATKGKHSKNHPERDDNVLRDPNTQPIYKFYSKLKMFSHNARYNMNSENSGRVTEMEGHLTAIKKHLSRYI